MSTIAFRLDKNKASLNFVKDTETRLENVSLTCYSKYLIHSEEGIVAVFRLKLVPRWFMRLLSKRGLRKAGYKGVILKYNTEDILHYLVVRCHKKKFTTG